MKGNWVDEPDPAHGLKGQPGVAELYRNMKRADKYAWQ